MVGYARSQSDDRRRARAASANMSNALRNECLGKAAVLGKQR